MRLGILNIGVAALLYCMLDLILDVRGANDFIRPFHYVGILVTVTLSTLAFWTLLKLLPNKLGPYPLAQTVVYLTILLAVWHVALPLGDHFAELRERATKSTYEVGDTGYGWFYWDDSGMGNWPMSMLGVVLGTIRIPVAHILLIAFVYLVLRLPISPRGQNKAEKPTPHR